MSFINYRPLVKAEHLRSKEEIHQIIGRRHGFDPKLEDAFQDWDTIENSQRVDKIFDAMDYFLGVVGFVTLVLGAIGIVNIMLVSVAERTREIGLRKALGATYRNILTQFFMEGAFLTMLSGGIGLLITTGLPDRTGAFAVSPGIRHAAHCAVVGSRGDYCAGHCGYRGWDLSGAQGRAAGSGRSHEAGIACWANWDRKLTTRCATTNGAASSPCWGWPGASPLWSCCWHTARVLSADCGRPSVLLAPTWFSCFPDALRTRREARKLEAKSA